MVAPVGFLTDHDHDFLTQKPQFKAEPASPGRVREILLEQRAHEAALAAEEEKRLAARRAESARRLEIEKTQVEVRIACQKLTVALWGQPAKSWNPRQQEMFALICDWLEGN